MAGSGTSDENQEVAQVVIGDLISGGGEIFNFTSAGFPRFPLPSVTLADVETKLE